MSSECAGHDRRPRVAFHNSRTRMLVASGALRAGQGDEPLVWPSVYSSVRNSSATFLRKKCRSSLRVQSTSSTISGETRPVAPIHWKNFLNEARYTFILVTEAHRALRGNQSSKKSYTAPSVASSSRRRE